jgi:C4-dicarboxylate transporter DctM subunit
MGENLATTADHVQDRSNIIFRMFNLIAVLLFAGMLIFPLLDVIGRPLNFFPIRGNTNWVQHFTLWIAFIGAILATFENKHLAVATATIFKIERGRKLAEFLVITGSLTILLGLTKASYDLVYYQVESPETIGGWFPLWLAQMIMPAGFLMLFVFTLTRSSLPRQKKWAALGTTLILFLLFAIAPAGTHYYLLTTFMIVLIILTFLGMPIYIALGGAGLLLFYAASIPVAALPAETYRIITQPVLPSIPLFALAGTVLAHGGAPARLVRFVKAWTSWLPGGAAISTIFGCALFTAITGASGVTILALGGLLLPILLAAGQQKDFGVGLLTASGSVGLLFPPSLPVILYGIYGLVAIDRLFLAGLLPGILLLLIMALFTTYRSRKSGNVKEKFDIRDVLAATWGAKGDLLLPLVVVAGLFGGLFTLVETAAITAFWALVLEVVIYRQIKPFKGSLKIVLETALMVGALLIVLGLASGLVSYLVDEQIPLKATDWVQQAIHSKYVFLLMLNILLLMVGALMDIYSAIVVFVPLIVPVGIAFGVDTAHLGIIFLANLELGYLTPPVGMNLFFSSLRFEQPLLRVWKTVVPFLLIFLFWVLFITYIPELTLLLPSMFGR